MQVAKLLGERDLRRDELDALLRRSPQDLWRSDLDDFSTKWEELLEKDVSDRVKSLKNAKNKGAKGKGTAAAKKRAKYDSDEDDDDFEVSKPKKKAAAAPKAKPAVALPPTSEPEIQAIAVQAKNAAKRAPAVKKAKQQVALPESDEEKDADEGEEMEEEVLPVKVRALSVSLFAPPMRLTERPFFAGQGQAQGC